MRFFAFITLCSAFLLFLSKPFAPNKIPPKKSIPAFIKASHRNFKEGFQHPQNANILWAFITGEKYGISPYTQKSFKDLELNFLFSPSGIHVAGFLSMVLFFFKKSKHKKMIRMVRWAVLVAALFLPYMAIKRIVCFRILFLLQRFLKRRIRIESLFLATFFISFLMGHFKESPLSFILSFLYMGTFIALADRSKFFILMGLFSSHLIICFFSGSEISFVSLFLNLPLLALFSILLPLFYFYFLTFHWIHFNWIEWIVRAFILCVHWSARLVQGTFVSSTFFLIFAVWILLLKKRKRYLLIALLLHGNIAISPTSFYSGSYSQVPRQSVRK
ncbi:MAG: ComEC/Rec2 family competence protein [Bacteriovorax sp.]|jgi:hypothetical protein